ncbi:lipopolysaccharide biosynthesis protein [Clostridium sp. 001]|uniref:lipopolysaccharide biosynthesis protein n=1 Tax=Clostridium sp. 001 TaxID=1970093 RepID=UPI001C2C6B8B|nr:lipopolysaccharide biosynthesis protein [Clostridium sp. 001]
MSIKKASIINAIAKYSSVIMSILFSAILARILSPEDYGIVAIVTVFTAFFAVLCDMGIGAAIIQRKDLTSSDLGIIFGLTARIGIILAISFCGLSIPISILYGNSVYKPICCILSISIFFNTLNMVPNALLMKDKKFVLVGVRMVIVNVLSYILTIIMALLGAKYYALVFQSVIFSIANFIWNYHSTKPRLIFKFDKKSIQKIKSYSVFQFLFSFVNYFERNLDNLLVGKIMGNYMLAYYDKGYRLMSYPVSNLAGIITPVLHPILSDYQDKQEKLLDKYIHISKLLSLIGTFVTPLCFCTGSEIILIMYGNQWRNSILLFKFLSLGVWPMLMMSTTGAIYQSIGNTKLLFKAGLINGILTITFIIIGVISGSVRNVAICVSIANYLNMIITFYILINKGLKKSFWKFAKHFIGDLIAMVMIAGIGYVTFSKLAITSNLISFIIKGLVILAMYIIYLYISKQINIINLLFKVISYRKMVSFCHLFSRKINRRFHYNTSRDKDKI